MSEFIVCFFFNDTATTEIYTLSLHDALPISPLYKLYKNWNFWTDDADEVQAILNRFDEVVVIHRSEEHTSELQSHSFISYAVFCLKKKKMN